MKVLNIVITTIAILLNIAFLLVTIMMLSYEDEFVVTGAFAFIVLIVPNVYVSIASLVRQLR